MTPLKIRASSMPLFNLCPAAAHGKSDISINPYNEAGTEGTEVHRLCELMIEGDSGEWRSECNDDDIARMVWLAEKRTHEITGVTDYYAESKRTFTGEYLYDVSGHIDLVFIRDGLSTIIIDYKTTRLLDKDYSMQMMTYLWLFAPHIPGSSQTYQYMTLFLRDDTKIVSREYTFEEIDEVVKPVFHRIVNGENDFCPGKHCDGEYCSRRFECPAYAQMVSQAANALEVVKEAGLPVSDEDFVRLVVKAEHVRAALKMVDDAKKLRVEAAGGEMKADGYVLRLVDTGKDRVHLDKALPILRESLTDSEILEACSISKSALGTAIKAKAERGSKGKAFKEAVERLRESEAIIKSDAQSVKLFKEDGDDGE